ncbi:amine sulfotransferase-like [Sebastes umbrosus]|uniref:amine sulfotransferase-like n=1 Tax=Sebastes umbrosus TaxID=72105 RepID=UPI00189D557C|nr:amine sulfotransferase-like [Sebastes umbrosus]
MNVVDDGGSDDCSVFEASSLWSDSTGTTWMKQLLIQILDAAHPDSAEDGDNNERIPYLECLSYTPVRERSDPQIYGTHLPPDMLPQGVEAKQNKVVYVWRNPKDVLVSFYHFAISWVYLDAPRSFEEFFQQFLDGDGRFRYSGLPERALAPSCTSGLLAGRRLTRLRSPSSWGRGSIT